MTQPTYAQLKSLVQGVIANETNAPGEISETIIERILTCMAVMASGQNPDGTSWSGFSAVSGVFKANGGTNTAASTTVTTPTASSGVAFTPSATVDSTVYFQVNAAGAGSYTLTMGPSTGTENTIASAVAMVIGSDALVTLRVPGGWKVVITLTTVTVSQTTVVTS